MQQPGVMTMQQPQPQTGVVQQQQQPSGGGGGDEFPSQIFSPHQFNLLRTQIHTYKLIMRNEPVPLKLLEGTS